MVVAHIRKSSIRDLIRYISLVTALSAGPILVSADTTAFDLIGPSVEMKVMRNGKSLPISAVPNFQPGDKLWIHPDFPPDQAARYLLVVAFLRGSTNPPPESWFIKAESWSKQVREEGVVVTVPQEAQQALLFLAPETGGDFATLRSTVRGRPGIFVRASQDLNRASLDRTRLERYLADVRAISDADPKALREHSVLLARTLGIRLEQQCFDRPLEEQASCLTQHTDNLVLDDGHSQSMVAALTSGANSELIGAVSATSLAGGGFYSAYVGAVVDLARVLGNVHTASYQYIPALALPKDEQMNLKLNNPPSFRKPLSVIVVGLPAIEAAQLPPLRPVDPEEVFCLQKSSLVLPVEGAPLVFSGSIAHDFVLRVASKDGKGIDLPARADAASGGFLIDTHTIDAAKLGAAVMGSLNGSWGFESYQGPHFRFRASRPAQWTIPSAERTALIVGRDDVLHLQSDGAVCVDGITIQDTQGRDVKTTWKRDKPDQLEIKVALKDQPAGPLKMHVKQFGLGNPDEVSLHAYAEAAHLESFAINAGDREGVLKGKRLDEVDHFELNGVSFGAGKLTRSNDRDELQLSAAEQTNPPAYRPDEHLVAHVTLRDGRVLDLPTTVGAARPRVVLVSKSIPSGSGPSVINLGSHDELPLDGQITFLLKTETPEKFPYNEKVEVATADEAFSTTLSLADATLMLQDSENLLATFVPRKAFGPSAFGPLRFRPVQADGTKGDWQPLATLVRVPALKELRCPESPDKPCQLTGANLFLIDAVASDAEFAHTAPVPTGFIDSELSVPHPNGGGLYIKLRDDPATVSTLALPVSPLNP